MSSKVSDKEIADFVKRVRHELKNLSKEDISELTDALESDLKDRRDAEGNSFKLGVAADYAAELAESAGLKVSDVEATRMNLRFLRIWQASLSYLRTLAPAWAIIRAWVAYSLVFSPIVFGTIHPLPGSQLAWLVLAIFIVISVWLSNKQYRVLRYPLIVLNSLLLVASPILVQDIAEAAQLYSKYVVYEYEPVITFQGNPVRGVCAVDIYGNKTPIQKLLDENGYEIYTAEGIPETC